MKSTTPRHVAIIMDGNGRWAQERGLPRLAGHEQGSKSIRACVEAAIEAGVEIVTLYAFSAENWKRPAAEVAGLMLLLERFLDEKLAEMQKEGVRLLAIAALPSYPEPVSASCNRPLPRLRRIPASPSFLPSATAVVWKSSML